MTHALTARIQAVRDLHTPIPKRKDARCTECGFRYPCATVAILDGGLDAEEL